MKDFSSFFILLILVTILYLYLEGKASEVTYVKANDGSNYLVRKYLFPILYKISLRIIKKKFDKVKNNGLSSRPLYKKRLLF